MHLVKRLRAVEGEVRLLAVRTRVGPEVETEPDRG